MKGSDKRTVCIVTGTRAEYGLLHRVIEHLKSSKFELKLVVTGSHLSKKYGLTYHEILKDGHEIDEKIDIDLQSDTQLAIGKSLAKAVERFTIYFDDSKPDIVLILGDRYEMLGVASAATVCRIPIAHIHGGENTVGVIDEAIRHRITKMSHFHFVSTAEYRNRVIQLGENPSRVFNVGSLGVDNSLQVELLSKEEVEKAIGTSFKKNNILITYHPETLKKQINKDIKSTIDALDTIENALLIFTAPNADIGSEIILSSIKKYVKQNQGKAIFFESLGHLLYLSCLKFVDCVVGNSSSGIIEVPSFKIPTINIGDRQKGRISAKSVIHSLPIFNSLCDAFQQVYNHEMNYNMKNIYNPYQKENTAEEIVNILGTVSLDKVLYKQFHDIK